MLLMYTSSYIEIAELEKQIINFTIKRLNEFKDTIVN